MVRQVEEERAHAEKFIQHVPDRGGDVELRTILAPVADFTSSSDPANAVWDLERATTDTIHRLYELTRKEGD
jgi:ferritin